MRINDIINENLEEAISVTQYEQTVEDAVRLGIAQAAAVMSGLKGRNPEEERLMLNDRSGPLFNRFHGSFPDVLAEKISNLIRVKLIRELGKDVPLTVAFDETEPRVNGLADDYEVILTNRYVKKLSKEILESVKNSVTSSYSIDEWVDSTFFTFKMLGSQDRYLTGIILDDSKKTIESLVDTVLHELVHVIQHHRQFQKGRTDTEYRSYLDKKKGEFYGLHSADTARSDAESERYNQLYLASPQEISAFAHQMAMSLIRDYDFKNAKSEEELTPLDAEDVMSYVKKYIHNRYSDPKTQKEYQVFKRYAKLVYQEVQRYIENVRKNFKKVD